MILIADSGSTKTDWRLLAGDDMLVSYETAGLNPYHMSTESMMGEINTLNLPEGKKLDAIHFYGSGIASEDLKDIMGKVFRNRFGDGVELRIENDQLAAARALFADDEGIACILGTGSSSCLYKDGLITDQVPALGYILGDEGSGADVGIRFVNALFKRTLPNTLSEEIISREKLDMADILDHVYRMEYPARFLASLTRIVKAYIHHDAIYALVAEAFESFIQNNILKYKGHQDYTIGFVGSVAHHFRDILAEGMKKNGCKPGRIFPSPMEGLLVFHDR